ncbi:uncharacterized protein LOC126373450 [Pectinophora gossypiella]|uniref:uncharacterized protein LOC126373450 n=1 Tax=Pectinophora gossypiella TaxID=13191 RepID=UPI00214ED693|nr:uncharacterized protein LOC126373450 [Pectinophora gossypiella]
MDNKEKCCIIESVFGYNLEFGVRFVGTSTILVSLATFLAAVVGLVVMTSKENEMYGRHPIQAANLVIVLVFFPMSLYQILLSTLLLWQAVKMHGNVFLCSLWFSSHTTILSVYAILFVGKAAVCLLNAYYITGLIIVIAGILYEGT